MLRPSNQKKKEINMSEKLTSNPEVTAALEPHKHLQMDGVIYPENGQWPKVYLNFDELVEQFPWAGAVKDELKILYARQSELRPDIKKPPTNQVEYDLISARICGTLSTLWNLGLTAINGKAKDEL